MLSRTLLRSCVSALLLASFVRADEWAPNLTFAATYDDNVTNGRSSLVQTGALEFAADVLASERYALGRFDALELKAHGAASWWERFRQLTTGAIGARAEWHHQFGADPLAAETFVELGADAVAAKDGGRRGTATFLTLIARKRINPATRLALSQVFERHDARATVYDVQSATTEAEIARDLTPTMRVSLAAFWRQGDVVSHSQPRADFDAAARARAIVETFGTPLIAYAIDARTLGGRISVIRALDEFTALTLAYEYRSTEEGPIRFQNQRLSLGFVNQF